MKHTECKDCELSNGDCGYHFKMDGKTNYDIASLSACDKYGNCEFFKAKAKPQGDLKSCEALKAYARKVLCGDNPTNSLLIRMFDEIIDKAPSVEPEITNDDLQAAMTESYRLGYELAETKFKRPQGEWIPISERLPEALQSVLVTSKSGRVYTSYIAHGDWEYGGDVIAWQPLPEPYEKGSAE